MKYNILSHIFIFVCSVLNNITGEGKTMSKRQLLLISSSRVHGYDYYQASENELRNLLDKNKVKKILFVPYAIKDHDSYVSKISAAVGKWGYNVEGIHKFSNPIQAVNEAESIFIGGGNTFQLLKTLYDLELINPIRKRVLEDGVPYIGTSAGTNVATKSIHTTNDMPIVYPPSLDALNLVPFNINPHYVDADESSTHKGETREERILQYMEQPHAKVVLGLREGCSLVVEGDRAVLKGLHKARLFMKNSEPKEIEIGTDLSYLL